jgi:hypothetical protein
MFWAPAGFPMCLSPGLPSCWPVRGAAARFCIGLLFFAMLGLAWFCLGSPCFALLCFALIRLALHGFALLCVPLPCLAWLRFLFLFIWGGGGRRGETHIEDIEDEGRERRGICIANQKEK